MSNHLRGQTSPYLLQHADNPVDWYPWGREALQKAKIEDNPIFLSIGYSPCHWCHVMARESFEDLEIARLLNESFVSIKVDREERPDIDSLYMAACQAFTGSGGGLLESDYVMAAIATRYRETGHPRNLTLIHALGIGNGKGSGLGRLAIPGLVKRIIGGHWSWSSELQKMARDNEIEAYCLPTGIIMTLYRESGAGRPGVISSVGLGTFVDPLISGGKCNDITCEDIVSRIELDGKTWLLERPLRADLALIRAHRCDTLGNLTYQLSARNFNPLIALAADITLVEPDELVETGELQPDHIVTPGAVIDHIIVSQESK